MWRKSKIENRKSKIQEDGLNPSLKDNCRPSAISSSVPRPSSGAWKLGAMPKMVMAASTLPVSFHGFDVVSKDNNGKGDRTLIHFFSLPDGEDFYSQVFDSTVTECLRSEVQQLTSIYSNTSVIATVKLSEPSSKIGIDAK